jgi:hypothetical protein
MRFFRADSVCEYVDLAALFVFEQVILKREVFCTDLIVCSFTLIAALA